MIRRFFRRRLTRVVAGAVLIGLIVVLGFGVYVANMAGALPWQTEPTRIPITPFAGIPGFSAPAADPTATPVQSTPAAEHTNASQGAAQAHWDWVIAGDRQDMAAYLAAVPVSAT